MYVFLIYIYIYRYIIDGLSSLTSPIQHTIDSLKLPHPTPSPAVRAPVSRSRSIAGRRHEIQSVPSLLISLVSVAAAPPRRRSIPSPVPKRAMADSGMELIPLLKVHEEDSYGGVTVHMDEQMEPADFAASLRASISEWRLKGKKGVWIKMPLELSSLVDPAVKEGFWYHHAEKDYVMLVYWIPTDCLSTIPPNASHRVGIGAFVLNSKREVLVVKENSGKFKGTGVWKLPTGVVGEGEDILTAAIREVEEETGIKTEFVEILAFRQSHESFFNKSDLLFICMLQPKSSEIKEQEVEIEAAQWMPIDSYKEQPFVKENLQFSAIADICKKRSEQEIRGFGAEELIKSSGKKFYIYRPE